MLRTFLPRHDDERVLETCEALLGEALAASRADHRHAFGDFIRLTPAQMHKNTAFVLPDGTMSASCNSLRAATGRARRARRQQLRRASASPAGQPLRRRSLAAGRRGTRPPAGFRFAPVADRLLPSADGEWRARFAAHTSPGMRA
jgi:hypothetical protein